MVMKTDGILICPVCGKDLFMDERSLKCQNRHCFDMAKEGYVNLLNGQHKNGKLIGDNRDMALSRQSFLNNGYFSALSEALSDYALTHCDREPVMLDICCGEGYYSEQILQKIHGSLFGLDISKEMVRLAAKRKTDASFFVANLSHIPLKSESIDLAFHLFAPFHENEFSRILKKNGKLISVIPGENHLFQLKQRIYDSPYKNDEKPPQTKLLTLTDKIKISRKITLTSEKDIQSLFQMTPYYYRTSPSDKAKLDGLKELETEIEFVLCIYEKD